MCRPDQVHSEVARDDGVGDASDLGGQTLQDFLGVEQVAVADELVAPQETHLQQKARNELCQCELDQIASAAATSVSWNLPTPNGDDFQEPVLGNLLRHDANVCRREVHPEAGAF